MYGYFGGIAMIIIFSSTCHSYGKTVHNIQWYIWCGFCLGFVSMCTYSTKEKKCDKRISFLTWCKLEPCMKRCKMCVFCHVKNEKGKQENWTIGFMWIWCVIARKVWSNLKQVNVLSEGREWDIGWLSVWMADVRSQWLDTNHVTVLKILIKTFWAGDGR